MRRKHEQPIRRQDTPEELLGACLSFIQRKFYQGKDRAFSKDRQRILKWVVLWPAKWLDERGVTVPSNEYREILMSVFMDSIRYGDTENIEYLPAWLARVIQSHFQHHGDAIYQRAKSFRNLLENAVRTAHSGPVRNVSDPVREMAQASRLIRPRRHGKRRPVSTPKKDQLTLL